MPTPMHSRDGALDIEVLSKTREDGSAAGSVGEEERTRVASEILRQREPCDKWSRPQDVPKLQAQVGGSNLCEEVEASGRQKTLLATPPPAWPNWRNLEHTSAQRARRKRTCDARQELGATGPPGSSDDLRFG